MMQSIARGATPKQKSKKQEGKQMTYFTNCKTAEELKKAYRKVARELHPDSNSDRDTTAEFQKMQQEFEQAFEQLKNVHVNKDGEQYEKETTETAAEFMDLIDKLLHIPGIDIELCGSWIWITGNTKPVKDELKSFGFKFSRNKAAWYFHREPYRKHSKKSMSLDEIRNMYGSAHFAGPHKPDPDPLPVF
jgi:curved DNA-binding protein CbpA